MDSNFSASYVLNSYIAIENMLSEVLQFIPYGKEHLTVWSPKLVTILLEACSQLDSLWAYQARESRYVPKRDLNIHDYFGYFGEYLAPKWVVFWSEEPQQLYPFGEWRDKAKYVQQTYSPLDWWAAYNKVKHDRLTNRHEATLERAVHALAGLLLAILRYKDCRQSSVYAWMAPQDHPYPAYLDDESSSPSPNPFTGSAICVTVNTKLFTYAPYWGRHPVPRKAIWQGSDVRFGSWLERESSKLP